ncbi:hypothetical protein HX005_14125 [Acinetobacter sp. R933-2]|uniref:hypothetical protein n=1 Tax=Acinetobacter sp. R933-2 TaxID=2746728 RepID=UPI002577D003|nr:hypothetical protein [Acinetobacter sp. R933-2]MDM1248528.1 hypothetical protein [Acinetobacter sp. R933-2]
MKEIARTQVRMPPELMHNIKHIADERFTSMNTIIVEVLQQYIDNKKADRTRQSNQSACV